MKIVTVATAKERYFPYLEQSCARNGCDLVVLGLGETWGGYAWRAAKLQAYLDGLSEKEIVVCVDAYDIVILQHATTIIDTFLRMKAALPPDVKIICSEDRSSDYGTSFKIFNWLAFHACTTSVSKRPRYINAGTYIGYAGDVRHVLRELCNEYNCNDPDTNDQVILQKYCTKYDHYFAVDVDLQIFLVICSPASKIDEKKHAITYTSDGSLVVGERSLPCILHGSCNADMDAVLRRLGYEVKASDDQDDTMGHRLKYFAYNAKHFTSLLLPVIVLFVVALCAVGVFVVAAARYVLRNITVKNQVVLKTMKAKKAKKKN
jgi:hypothetical protein